MEPVLLEENEIENIEKSTHAEEIKEIVKVLRTEDDPWEALKSIAFVVEKIIKVPIGGKYYKSLRAHHREGQQMSECKYCDCKKGETPSKSLIFKTLDGGVLGPIIYNADIYDDATLVFGLGDEAVASVKIEYCPMCGRKLNSEILEKEEAK